jgi:uncharacterized protein
MLLTLDNQTNALRVRRYAPDEIWIGDQCVRAPCILAPHQLLTGWEATSIATLTRAQLQPALALQPRILLVGAARDITRPPAALRREIEALGVALECMELGAACRTYNVLSQEGRDVVAGLIPAPGSAPEEGTGEAGVDQPITRS